MDNSPDENRVAHTPGPWMPGSDQDTYSMRYMVYADDSLGSRIADCSEPGHGVLPDQRLANVRLIAAAPDLLQSLREVLGWYVEGGHAVPRIYIDRANAAIAKVEGRS